MKQESRKNKVKEMLKEGKKVVGTFCLSNSRASVEVIAACGMDYVLIDTEHFMTNPETIEQMITAAESAGIVPFVRVQENVNLIDRCVSAGARGVMVPMVNTKEEAQAAVDTIKYAPIGKRGVCNPRAITYGAKGLESMINFYKEENDNILLICQIETAQAVENLPEIIKVKGIDTLFVGRMDLSHSMGLTGQFDHPEVIKKVDQALKMGKDAGIPMSVITFNGEDTNKFFAQGFDLVTMACDLMFLSGAVSAEMAKIKR